MSICDHHQSSSWRSWALRPSSKLLVREDQPLLVCEEFLPCPGGDDDDDNDDDYNDDDDDSDSDHRQRGSSFKLLAHEDQPLLVRRISWRLC